MRKITKLVVIILLFLIIQGIQINNNYVCASFNIINTNTFDPSNTADNVFENELSSRANNITTVIRNIGIVVAVLALMGIGIKTMVGSTEEKAEYKKALPGYLLGVVLVVAITLLPSLIQTLAKGIF